MEEIVLKNKKHGMRALFLTTLVILALIGAAIAFGVSGMDAGVGVCLILVCFAWFPYLGLRVLKPQEALVLTLFG